MSDYTWVYAFLVVSLWSWDRSTAHFNSAITVGEMIFKSDDFGVTYPKYILILLMQLIGCLVGTFLTWQGSYTYDNPNGFQKTIIPAASTLCPPITGKPTDCTTNGSQQMVVKYEFMSSLFFVFSWLIVRNFEADKEIGGIENLLKPIIAFFVY